MLDRKLTDVLGLAVGGIGNSWIEALRRMPLPVQENLKDFKILRF